MACLLSQSFATYSGNLATKPCLLPVRAGVPSMQMPQRFFRSNHLCIHVFLTKVAQSEWSQNILSGSDS